MSVNQRTIRGNATKNRFAMASGARRPIESRVSNANSVWQVLVLSSNTDNQTALTSMVSRQRHVRMDASEPAGGPKYLLSWSEEVGFHRSTDVLRPSQARFDGGDAGQSEWDNIQPAVPQSLSPGAGNTPAGSADLTSVLPTNRSFEANLQGQSERDIRGRSLVMTADSMRFLVEAAHDIRSPIAAANQLVSTVANRLRRDEPLSRQELTMLDAANLRLLQANNWAEGMLLERNLELGSPVVVRNRFYPPQLQNLVKPLLDSLADLREVQLIWDGWDRSLPKLYTDANHLSRVIVNLGTNAIQASQPGQSVSINILGQAKSVGATQLTIDIRDQGPGLSPEFLRQVNQPDVHDLPSGNARYSSPAGYELDRVSRSSGLGLRTAKSLILGLGGTLSAETVSSGGSLMRIALPVDDPQCLICNWLLRLSATMEPAQRQEQRRVQIHAIRIRDLNLSYSDAQIQQAAEQFDFVYRVSADRWLWLRVSNRSAESSTSVNKLVARLNRLSTSDHAVCLATQVFESRPFSLDSLHSAADHRSRLPLLAGSVADKMLELMGTKVPTIDDIESSDHLNLFRPILKRQKIKIVRADQAEGNRPHLTESNKPSTVESTDDSRLSKALAEIAKGWYDTQSKLDRSIMRIDAPTENHPQAKYLKKVGVNQ